MTLFADTPEGAGRAYARARRFAGLPPIKGSVRAVPGADGPVLVVCGNGVYTLFTPDGPAPSAG